jgi:hypothetical protein
VDTNHISYGISIHKFPNIVCTISGSQDIEPCIFNAKIVVGGAFDYIRDILNFNPSLLLQSIAANYKDNRSKVKAVVKVAIKNNTFIFTTCCGK